MSLWYLAGPYRGETGSAEEIERNVTIAQQMARKLIGLGYNVIVPHQSYYLDDGSQPDEWWLEAVMEQMRRCDGMLVMPGKSAGTEAEIREAQRIRKTRPFDILMIEEVLP